MSLMLNDSRLVGSVPRGNMLHSHGFLDMRMRPSFYTVKVNRRLKLDLYTLLHEHVVGCKGRAFLSESFVQCRSHTTVF